MGGFGAIKPALSNPDLFVFAGALSPAIDVPRRRFSFRRVQQSWAVRSILGHGAATRAAATIRLIARSVAAAKAPYLLCPVTQMKACCRRTASFAAVLAKQHLSYEFHVVPDGHDWTQWNKEQPALFDSLLQRLGHTALQ